MKNLIKIIVTAVIITGVLSCAAYAAQEWTMAATDDIASSTIVDDTVSLKYDEGEVARSATAECAFDFSDNRHITVSFVANVSGFDSGTRRKFYFRESSLISMEVLAFDETEFSVLGSDISGITLEEDTDYYVVLGIDVETKDMVVYLNGEKVFDDNLGTKWKSSFKLESLKAFIRNYTLQKTPSGSSEFILKNLKIGDSATAMETEPENQAEFIEGSSLEGIDVDFDGGVSPEVIAADNFILQAGTNNCAVVAERKGNGVRIKSEDGFNYGTTYTLTAKTINDVFGNKVAENITVSFTTAPEGYQKPTVTLSTDVTEMYDFQSAKLSITAESQNEIDKVEMYINDELSETFTSNTQYDFYNEKGSYKIFLIAYDLMGGSVKSDNIFINIKKNILPVITVEGVASGVPMTRDKLAGITVSAEDTDGTLQYINVYLGDTLVFQSNESSFSPDLNMATMGRSLLKIVAADDVGEESVKEISLVITGESNEKVICDTDFENYSSDGDTFIGGVFSKGVLEAGAAIRSSKAYGDEHGTVVEYVSEGDNPTGTWMTFNTANTTQSFLFSMDTYILSDKSTAVFFFKTGSSIIDPLTFQNGKLTIGGLNGKITVDFPVKEWHNLRTLVNMNDHVFSVWIDDVLVAENYALRPEQVKVETRISLSPNGQTGKTGVVFDNLVIKYYEQPVQIVSVGYDAVDDCMEIAPNASTIKLNLSAMVNTASINQKSVMLYCGERLMDYDSVKCTDGKTVIITLKEKLKSKTQYRAELTNKVIDSSGNLLKDGAGVNFSTTYADIDVKKTTMTQTGGKIKSTATVINTTDQQKSCYAVLTVLSGDETKGIVVKKITVPPYREVTETVGELDISGGIAELFFREAPLGNAIADIIKQ